LSVFCKIPGLKSVAQRAQGKCNMSQRRNLKKAVNYWRVSLIFFLILFVDRAFQLAGHDPMAGLLTTCLLGLLPVPVHIGLIYWLDRMEPEPPNLIWETFLWGATGAIVFAFILEVMGGYLVASLTRDEAVLRFVNISVFGPVIEETLKAAALLFVFKRNPDDFENVGDGIIYAAMVGIGFSVIENIFYYESAWVRGGTPTTLVLFGFRGVLTSYLHPLFTAMTGIGLGVAAKKGKGVLSVEPILGFLGAIALHGSWNYSGLSFYPVYTALALWVFGKILDESIYGEDSFLKAHLQPELEKRHIDQTQYDEICNGLKRRSSVLKSLSKCQFRTLWNKRKVQLAAKELAFHRYRVAIQGVENEPLEKQRERDCLSRLKLANSSIHKFRRY
jgi:RsiW-degrading membrane proteinase PrsW (M82 family)